MFGFFKGYTKETQKTALSEYQKGSAVIIDVREEEEVNSNHIVGAQWIPLSFIRSDQDKAIKLVKDNFQDKKVYIYCRSGNRSQTVTDILKGNGINAINLGGLGSLKSEFKTEPGKLECCS